MVVKCTGPDCPLCASIRAHYCEAAKIHLSSALRFALQELYQLEPAGDLELVEWRLDAALNGLGDALRYVRLAKETGGGTHEECAPDERTRVAALPEGV